MTKNSRRLGRYFVNSDIRFHEWTNIFNDFRSCVIKKTSKFTPPFPIHPLQPPVPQNLREQEIVVCIMAKAWCQCDKCDGGKVVSRSTWYLHRKRPHTAFRKHSHPPSGIPARRNLPLTVPPDTSIDIDADELEGVDPLALVRVCTELTLLIAYTNFGTKQNPKVAPGQDMAHPNPPPSPRQIQVAPAAPETRAIQVYIKRDHSDRLD